MSNDPEDETPPPPPPPESPAHLEPLEHPAFAQPAEPHPDDAPILPAATAEAAMRDALGAPTRRPPTLDDDRDGEPSPKRSRRAMVIASLSIIGGLSGAALVFLGRANAQRYMIECDSARITAEQGRAFPPWGSHPLAGAEWKAIAMPPNAECKPRETESEAELGSWYLALLVERASATLTARDLLDKLPPRVEGTPPKPSPLDDVSAQLDQALLLARAPERRDERKEIERLQGDVGYWRATARLRDASVVLADAAKQFDAAAALKPRHVSDAAAWAAYLRRLAAELHAGPSSEAAPATIAPPQASSGSGAAVPAGVALPVEPESSGTGSAGGSAAPAPTAVPSGGVLL